MTYDYYKAVRDDVRNAILEHDYSDEIARCESMDEVVSELGKLMWIDDYVTGNVSGSYTGDREKTKSYLAGNEELIIETLESAFGSNVEGYKNAILDPDFADVNIRCCLLDDSIWRVLEEPQINRYVRGLVGTKRVQSKNKKPVKPKAKKTVKAVGRKPSTKFRGGRR